MIETYYKDQEFGQKVPPEYSKPVQIISKEQREQFSLHAAEESVPIKYY